MTVRTLTRSLAGLALLLASDLPAQNPRLVFDINRESPPVTGVRGFVHRTTDGMLFFQASTPQTGAELFRSDGTTVELVRDIRPGTAGSSPADLCAIGNTIFFRADDGANGQELWKSDGTPGGTVLVRNIRPGASSSTPSELVAAGSTLFFRASDGTSGFELWKSDGSASGTSLVKDIWPGAVSSLARGLTAIGPTVYFVATDGRFRTTDLWKSDGTASGTIPVSDPMPFPATTRQLTPIGDKIYFYNAGLTAAGLYVSDGTSAGTKRVTNQSFNTFSFLQRVQGSLYFEVEQGSGQGFWWSNGTVIQRVKDIAQIQSTVALGNRLLFTADGGIRGRELWTSSGTDADTFVVEDIRPGPASSNPASPVRIGYRVFFSADDGKNGRELWQSDGTQTGTKLVRDIRPGAAGSSPEHLYVVGSTLYFAADADGNGATLWRSDGTASGTVRVVGQETGSAEPNWFCGLDDTLYFAADDGLRGRELWRTDRNGTTLVRDINPGASASGPTHLCRLGQNVYFSAHTPGQGRELWFTDGTNRGTRPAGDFVQGPASSFPGSLTRVGDRIAFQTQRIVGASRDHELRVGSNPFPVIHKQRVSLTTRWVPYIAPIGESGSFVFAGIGNTEPWVSDGTAAGTRQLADLHGTGNSDPREMTPLRGRVLFSAFTPSSGRELWITDGRTTSIVKDISPGRFSSNPHGFTSGGEVSYFVALRSVLYRTDGTSKGTFAIKDLGTSTIDSLTRVGSRELLLRVDDGALGKELWISDGTSAGTRLLADIRRGRASGLANTPWSGGSRQAFPVLRDVFLPADGGTKGDELWAYEPGAHTWEGAMGCASDGGPPVLRATDPVLGTTQRIDVEDVRVAAVGVLMLGFPGVTTLRRGCNLAVDPWKPFFVITAWWQQRGSTHRQLLPIPNDRALDRLRLTMQGYVFSPFAPDPFDLTNAVHETLGR